MDENERAVQERIFDEMRRFFAVWSIAILSISTATMGEARERPSELVANGNRLYAEKKFDKAELFYKDAQKSLPESPEINFNLGDVAYRKGDYDAAEEHYNKVTESANASRELRKKALYNLGNCAFMRGEKLLDSDLQKAMDSYRLSILRYQDVIVRDEYGEASSSEKSYRPDEDAKFNIEVARLRIKDILDKLKEQEEKRKEQQKQQEEFIKKLKEAIEKEQQIVNETGNAESRRGLGEDISETTKDVRKKQADNKETTNELARQLQQQIEAAKSSAAGGQQSSPVDENVLGAQNSLEEAEIEEGTALQHLDNQALPEAKGREEAALKKLQEALGKLTKPQQSQPQQGEQQQTGEQQKSEQASEQKKQGQSRKDEKKKDDTGKKMTPEQAQEELAKERKQATQNRRENLEEFLRRRPDYRQPRREYEPVDKDW
jgi:Ca-activated chloride channel family protein